MSARFVVLFAVFLMSCSKDTTGPTPATSLPRPVTLVDLALTGPESVPPGSTAQFKTTARFSDGTERDVTAQTVWSTNNFSSLTITSGSASGGTATGRSIGEAGISARYTPGTGQLPVTRTTMVLVIPDGTFRLLGRVLEPGGFPVPSVFLTVTSGTGSGHRRLTGVDGRASLYGVTGAARIEAAREGYRGESRDIVVTGPDQRVDFELTPLTGIDNLSGVWTLTVAASSRCAGTLPEEARVRTYTATVTSTGRDLGVVLSGATFFQTNNRFAGRSEPGGVVLKVGGYDYYYNYGAYGSFIAELLGANRLYITGNVNATISGNTISGILSGAMQVTTAQGSVVSACFAGDHQFRFTR